MFNIHSTELLLIAIVALIVIGPEKLPSAIRTASLWIGRLRRSFYRVKADIERELNADEIKRQLHNESVMAEIEEAKSKVESTARETEKSVKNIVSSEDFDPGLPKDAYLEEGTDEQDQTTKNDLDEASSGIKKPAKPLYGGGRNPKLAGSNRSSEESSNEA